VSNIVCWCNKEGDLSRSSVSHLAWVVASLDPDSLFFFRSVV